MGRIIWPIQLLIGGLVSSARRGTNWNADRRQAGCDKRNAVEMDKQSVRNAPKLLYVVSEDWYFWSHRLPVAAAARAAGFDVCVATRVHEHRECIEQAGFQVFPIRMQRGGFNVVREAASVVELTRLYRAIKPDIVHHVALKPILQGSLSARFARVPSTVNAIAGLGHVFSSSGLRALVLKLFVSFALKILLGRRGTVTIAQNPDDVAVLNGQIGIAQDSIVLIKGSGVDTERFCASTQGLGPLTVTMVSRMLWAKGAGVLAEAARILRERTVAVRVVLVGAPDEENPGSVPPAVLQQWHDEGVLEWRGHCNNVEEIWRESHIAVLPSYYGEGVPKCLLEAAACGLPIITTDTPGCREVVRDGENGILVTPRDPNAVADAIEKLASDAALRVRMGKQSRVKAETEYSEQIVQKATVAVYRRLLQTTDGK